MDNSIEKLKNLYSNREYNNAMLLLTSFRRHNVNNPDGLVFGLEDL